MLARVQVTFDCADPLGLAGFWVRRTAGTPPDIDKEVARLVARGATKLHGVTDDSGYFVVMQDPEGNEFCID